jgi:GNAT superfamily N-acetyltransferase
MSQPYCIRPAAADEIDRVMALFEARVEWLRSCHQSDQWAQYADWRPAIEKRISIGATKVLCEQTTQVVCGTITVGRGGDPDFWLPHELKHGNALYLSKLATHPGWKGQELGSLMLDWATDYAASEGLDHVRLDAWKTASHLHWYYEKRGWKFLRMAPPVDGASKRARHSGALFHKETQRIDLSKWLVPYVHHLPNEDSANVDVFSADVGECYTEPLPAIPAS